MKTNTTQLEILLVTNTTFIKKELYEKEAYKEVGYLSQDEQLERACWNGLLVELLPKNRLRLKMDEEFFIRQIVRGEYSLQIVLSDSTAFMKKQQIDKRFSIDPSLFLPEKMN